MISAICVTYGRVRFLESAIADFLNQDCSVPRELLVLNTFPRQSLDGDSIEGVRILNMVKRPASLGEARNTAVEQANGNRIVVWDDDDVYLPHHLSTFEKAWEPGLDWIWLDKRLCAMGDSITSIGQGCHGGCFGFTKRAWKEVGGYPNNMSVGEDRVLVQKIVKRFPGKRVSPKGIPPFIARWGQGTYHISGQGDDKPNMPSAYNRAHFDLSRRLASGQEKVGVIELVPHFDESWKTKAELFWAEHQKKTALNAKGLCVVELGRYGDIVNILPILQHINNEFGKPTLMVSRQFADLLDGVSYVNPHVVDLRNDQLVEAIKIAKSQYAHVMVAQIWGGKDYVQERKCESYNMDSWRACGFLHQFRNEHWQPVFDRRDDAREEAVTVKVINDKPLILANLTHSVSSPFPNGKALLGLLTRTVGGRFNVVDIGNLKLHRIYDLMGLMNWAACLVTVDSAQLHLAAGTTVPVVALVNDTPWLGTVPRCQRVVTIRYSDAAKNPGMVLSHVVRMASGPLGAGRNGLMPVSVSPPVRTIYHCCEQHSETNAREMGRKAAAQKSWRALYEVGVVPVILAEDDYPRTAESIGEKRRLPFLKDTLRPALEQANDHDIIFFTNDDNILHPKLPEYLRFHIALYGCACAQRCEFKHTPVPPLNRPPGDFTRGSLSHMGRDLFAFTRKWLADHWNEIPDFILGCSDWDLCLAAIVRNHFGIKTTRKNLEAVIHPAELPLGYVSHSWHAPHWHRPGYVNTAPGQIWNRRLFKCWAEEHAPHLTFDEHNCI